MRMCVATIVEKTTNIVCIKFALIKSYHLRVNNRILLWFRKLSQLNRYVNGTTFQSGLRFQTGWSSFRVSCKRALSTTSKHL